MGFLVGILKKIFKLIVYLAIIIAIILLIPNLPPYTKFTSIEIEPTQQLIGVLAPNTVLNNAEHLFKGKLLGPEAFQIYNGEVYTTLATGEIVKLSSGGHVTFVTKIGDPCTGLVQEHICGRPLGFVIDEKNKLMYVADAYHGIWKVNLVTDKKQLLVSPRVPISGRTPKIFNSVALGQNGDLYWTDSSSDYQLKDGVFSLFSDPGGRLFHYNSAKNESKVLLDDLWFANGVVTSPDNQFVLVAETSRFRIMKYYLNGPKKGKSEVFVAGLPGIPDNIRTLPDGSGVLISLYNALDEENPLIIRTLASTPLARKFITRLALLIELPFQFLSDQFHNHVFEEIVYKIGNFASVSHMAATMSGLIQIDWNGNIVASYYNTDGTIAHISDAIVFNDKLYTGCPHTQDYVGAVPAPPLLKKAFSSNRPVVKEQPKIKVEEIPKVSEQVPKQQQKTTQKQTEPKVVSKESEIKPKVTKDAEVKPKVVKKEAEVKPKVLTKESEDKPKVVSGEANKKPVVVPKEPQIKEPVKESKPTPKAPEVKAKVVPKEQVTKPKETDKKPSATKIKPDFKETETKVKPSKDADPKSKTESKVSGQTKTVPKQVKINSETKSEDVQKKSQNPDVKKQNTEEKTKSGESMPKPSTKQIPVEEKIPSDTAKPSKDTLKVIKKSGPQEIPHPNV
ncbi:adipocyte plasma membrane-associated protein Hemomucin [Nymphalis io]|uniref:adipocyte plasma membrane-associated protein Hemomucin n=1 Tax=Inachis io TaxID=171585 RepID=UPI002169DC16|nr:adipocyte plasma membrane-associated protein Hemomucin [Nymphalis io]